MKCKKLLYTKGFKMLGAVLVSTTLLGSMGGVAYAKDGSSKEKLEKEKVTIYRKTSLAPSDPREKKEFKINFHTTEPLGMHMLGATQIEIFIKGDDIKGEGKLYIHDEENLKGITTVPVGERVTVDIPSKGQLFLDVKDIKSTIGEEEAFNFKVEVYANEEDYKDTPIYDVRDKKISKEVIETPEEFLEAIEDNPDTGMIMISENVRMYMPVNGYIPEAFDPDEVLQKHEDTIELFNEYAGLDENDSQSIHHPRKNFVLVSARNKQAGFMSAGNQMLDTHPKNSKQYFEPRWGMYHEYGHLYEQEWSYVEIWNNMFAKEMAERNFGFTFIWGDDRWGYEDEKVKPLFETYYANQEVTGDFGHQIGLYFFVTLEEVLGEDFVADMERYWRENTDSPKKADYVAYAIADKYGINIIPYMNLFGLNIVDDRIYNQVIDISESTLMPIPNNPSFEAYQNQSTPVTVKSLYEGTNQVLQGIANPQSDIEVTVGGNTYQTKADDKGKFKLTIPEELTFQSEVTIVSTEPGKKPSKDCPVQVSTPLSDNKIHLQGLMNNTRTVIGFNPLKKEIEVNTLITLPANYQFQGEYFAVEFYKADGTLVKEVSVDAQKSAEIIEKELHHQKFEYGDYIKIRHREPNRTIITGAVINAPDLSIQEQGCKDIDLANGAFYITEEGLEYRN